VWLDTPPAPGTTGLGAQVRAHGAAVACTVVAADHARLRVDVAGALSGVSAGQTVVLYDGDRVVGSGTVTTTAPVAVPV
jgi:tRNA-specific 2-thiouridylase